MKSWLKTAALAALTCVVLAAGGARSANAQGYVVPPSYYAPYYPVVEYRRPFAPFFAPRAAYYAPATVYAAPVYRAPVYSPVYAAPVYTSPTVTGYRGVTTYYSAPYAPVPAPSVVYPLPSVVYPPAVFPLTADEFLRRDPYEDSWLEFGD